MTLSRFLRDFLYIPLGGNQKGRWKTVRNLMITMTLGGLWHGAAWGFVLWGALHGLALVVERVLRGRFSVPTWLRWLVVFNLIVLLWIPFRAPDLSLAGTVLGRLFTPGPATLFVPGVIAALAVVIGLQWVPERPLTALRGRLESAGPLALGAGLAVLVAIVGATVPSGAVPPFIYFQF
jgi:alginate O-acetyltransferase complex protein AlgI